MDGLTVATLCEAWRSLYGGARIEKIHQPTARELVLTVRSQSGTHRLLLSAHRQFARAHRLIRTKPENPSDAPMFCMLLRRRIEGGRIRDIRQPGWDRAIYIVVERTDEIGDLRQYVLVAELMGKHSNLILCEADGQGMPVRVIDAIVHVTEEMSRVRPMLPGVPFTPAPPQRRIPWDALQSGDVAGLALESLPPARRPSALTGLVAGMGPVTAAEVLHRARDLAPEAIVETVRTLYEAVLSRREAPSVGLDELGRPVAAAPFTLTSMPRHEPASSLDDALDRLYHERAQSELQSQMQRRLEQAVRTHLDRLRGKLAKLEETAAESEDHELLRIKGELLTTYAHEVRKGQSEVELPNYYDEMRPLRIELDPALTPIENAQRYFRLSSKRKRAIPVLKAEREQAEADIRYLENVLVHLRDAGPVELGAIEQELAQQGFLKPDGRRGRRPSKEEKATVRPAEYRSSDGFVIRVGRNNTQNDLLTLRQSQPHDMWLHVKDAPGSHVVIRTEGRDVPDQTLEEAALLAAWFSKARDSSQVAVDYTRAGQVWKPRGARPGQVLYEGHRTLFVTPERSRIEHLLAQRVDTAQQDAKRDGISEPEVQRD